MPAADDIKPWERTVGGTFASAALRRMQRALGPRKAPAFRGEEEQRSECHFAKAKSNDAQLVTTKSPRSKKSRNSAECPKIFRAPQEDAGPYGEDGNWIKPYREGAETLPYERTDRPLRGRRAGGNVRRKE